MIPAIRRTVSLPRVSLQALLPVLSVLAFGWLLVNDLIQPIVIYCLQIYLTF